MGDFVVAAGIGKLEGKGDFTVNAETGTLVYWSDEYGKDGRLGMAVVVNPKELEEFKNLGHSRVALLKAKAGEPLEYYAGACWSKGLDFQSRDQWEKYVRDFAAEKAKEW